MRVQEVWVPNALRAFFYPFPQKSHGIAPKIFDQLVTILCCPNFIALFLRKIFVGLMNNYFKQHVIIIIRHYNFYVIIRHPPLYWQGSFPAFLNYSYLEAKLCYLKYAVETLITGNN